MEVLVCLLLSCLALSTADDRVYFNEEQERRWNTPPRLTPEQVVQTGVAEARLLPLNFNLNSAHSLSIGASLDGVSVSQSNSFSQGSSLSHSQSSSLSAGFNGISASQADAQSHSNPVSGSTSESNSHSFSIGQAAASSHGHVANGHAASGAQSSVGSSQTLPSSSGNRKPPRQGHRQNGPTWTNIAPNYNGGQFGERRPVVSVYEKPSRYPHEPESLVIVQHEERNPNRWYRRPELSVSINGHRSPTSGPQRPDRWSKNQRPELQTGVASSSSSSSSSGGISLSQSSSHGNSGSRNPSSISISQVQTSGNAQGHAQGAAGTVQQTSGGLQVSIASGAASGSSSGTGHSISTSISESVHSGNRVNQQSGGSHGTSTSGLVIFPDDTASNIPREFVRSKQSRRDQKRKANDSKDIISVITDTFDDFLDYF